jgi:ABC-type multidrug transport system fused ATPase/permease subunit
MRRRKQKMMEERRGNLIQRGDLPLKRYKDLLAKYVGPLWPKVLLLAVLIFLSIGLQIVNPQIIRFFVDTAISSGSAEQLSSVTNKLLLSALAFLGVSLFLQIIGVAATYVGEDVGWRSTNQLRADLAQHCLRLDMSFHNVHTPGEMIERIDGDVGSIANFFSQFVIQVLGNLLLIIGVLIALAYEDWRVSVSLIAYTIVALGGVAYLYRIAVPYWQAIRQAGANLFSFLEEQLSSTEDVRSSGAVAYVIHSLLGFSKALLAKQLKGASMNALLSMVWTTLYTLGQIVAFVSSYSLFRRGEITVGSVFLIIYYARFVFQPLIEIATQVQNLQQAMASISRVETLYATQSAIESTHPHMILPAGPLAVMFDDVTFGYDETEPVLQNVSFHLEPGKVLGLLGRTGSGKTTLTHLLFRLYSPTQGTIHLGENGSRLDIREIELDNLCQRIGVVTQNVQLFQATVRDNLTFFDPSISDDRILQVIEELELSDWYASLPEGLDTELGSRGSNLSAGEAQLLAFTRVFLGDPGLVILDEASSRLDPATEQLIERAVDKLFKDRTGIVVAHRLSTVQRADQIMIIEWGQVLEFGDYDNLVHDPMSHFYKLLQTGLEEILA